jgi:hypothetical protein
MTRSLPRWVHRHLPRAAPPDSGRSLRSARVPPVDYLDKPPHRISGQPFKPGVQFLIAQRVQFRTSVDNLPFGRALGAPAIFRTVLAGDLTLALCRNGLGTRRRRHG